MKEERELVDVYLTDGEKSVQIQVGEVLEMNRLGKLNKEKSAAAIANAKKSKELIAEEKKREAQRGFRKQQEVNKSAKDALNETSLVDYNGMKIQKREIAMLKRVQEEREKYLDEQNKKASLELKKAKERKAAIQTKEEKNKPETKEEKTSGPMTKEKNLKNVKSGN